LHTSPQLKIFHAASQDIEILQLEAPNLPFQNVIDTQLAAIFLGLDEYLGLAKLLDYALNIKISKTETVSNWIKRPLSKNQCHYAVEDVLYLHPLYQFLLKELASSKKASFFEDECLGITKLADPVHNIISKIIKNSDSPRVKAILKDLVQWREEIAIKTNRPRNWVLSNNHLRFLSMHDNQQVWLDQKILNERQVSRYAKNIFAMHSKHQDLSKVRSSEKPEYKIEFDKISGLLRSRFNDIAESFNLPVNFLCSQKKITHITELFLKHKEIFSFEDWRGQLLNKKIKQVFDKISS